MRIIGKASGGVYLAQVAHEELEKAADLYYGKLQPLEVGGSVNLGQGHNYRGEIKAACQAMVEASERFERAQRALLAFARMVGDLPDPVEAAGGEG